MYFCSNFFRDLQHQVMIESAQNDALESTLYVQFTLKQLELNAQKCYLSQVAYITHIRVFHYNNMHRRLSICSPLLKALHHNARRLSRIRGLSRSRLMFSSLIWVNGVSFTSDMMHNIAQNPAPTYILFNIHEKLCTPTTVLCYVDS